ncbi:MAG: hypothetical protein CMM01_14780 [Rhodopirellula sp.]|nr:hypothetical protein [Rhodopirellula sp.]OUX50405.1 MAG: hypothetical protein CBE43_06790 [Rhodopirellula sp. TMED283]
MDNPDSSKDQQGQKHVDLTETCKNQCLQYLLDELAPEQVALFEERLGRSDQLAVELQRQAEMIVDLSEASTLPETSGKPTSSINPEMLGPQERKLLIKAFGIALAVCIAGFLFRTLWSTTSPQQGNASLSDQFASRVMDDKLNMTRVSESTLIARAWAAAQVADKDFNNAPHALLTGTDVQAINSLDDELELNDQKTRDTFDDSFSWMFTATFEIHDMETNDG